MSSDAQIRKRRDNKKKRKDDITEDKEGLIQGQTQAQSTPKTIVNGDLNIHVQKEASTGGGICAKTVFFVLLTILIALIALLVNNHREDTEFQELDTPLYSNLVKKSINELPTSAEEFEDQAFEENEIDELETEEENNSVEANSDEDADETMELSEENKADMEEAETENEARDTTELSEEVPEASEGEEDEEDQEQLNEDEDDIQSDSELHDDSTMHESGEADNLDARENEQSDETIRILPTEKPITLNDEIFSENLQEIKENYQMVIKFSVGTALVVVAYIVLVQKWKTGNHDQVIEIKNVLTQNETTCSSTNLSRRNTIVIPPNLEDVQCDIENIDEEYPWDNDKLDSDDETRLKPSQAKRHYLELQSTYSNTLASAYETQHMDESSIENYQVDEANVKDEEEDADDRDEDDDDFDDEISEGEDEELLKRLERKYGKLHNNYSDDEIEIMDEENEVFQFWKCANAKHGESESESENDAESDAESNGPQAVYHLADITNSDDWIIRDELDRVNTKLENE